MNKIHTIIILIFVILFGLLYISMRLGIPEKVSEFVSENILQNEDDDNDDDSDEDLPPEDVPLEDQQAGGEGGGSSAGGDGTSPSSPGCIFRTVSYSLENFEKSSICNAYQGNVCIDKTVECSVSVRNLDYEIDGDFEIIFTFSSVGTPDIYTTDSETKTVQPRALEEFLSSIQIQGSEASQEFTCNFEAGATPGKEICS